MGAPVTAARRRGPSGTWPGRLKSVIARRRWPGGRRSSWSGDRAALAQVAGQGQRGQRVVAHVRDEQALGLADPVLDGARAFVALGRLGDHHAHAEVAREHRADGLPAAGVGRGEDDAVAALEGRAGVRDRRARAPRAAGRGASRRRGSRRGTRRRPRRCCPRRRRRAAPPAPLARASGCARCDGAARPRSRTR